MTSRVPAPGALSGPTAGGRGSSTSWIICVTSVHLSANRCRSSGEYDRNVLEAIKASLDEYASSYKGDDDIGDAALQRSFAEVQTVFDTLEATTRSNGNAI